MQALACENQAGALKPVSGPLPDSLQLTDPYGTDLHHTLIHPVLETVPGVMNGSALSSGSDRQTTETASDDSHSQTNTDKAVGNRSSIDERSVHPFTYMRKDAESLGKSASDLDKDAHLSHTLTTRDEEQIGTDLAHLKQELQTVKDRHPTSIPQRWQEASAAVSKLTNDLKALEDKPNAISKSQLADFENDQAKLQSTLKALYQPALTHHSDGGGGKGSGGGGNGDGGGGSGSDGGKGKEGTSNLILGINGEKDLLDAIKSKMDFGTVRLWDSGVKMNQLMNADGTMNQKAWTTLAEEVDTAHNPGNGLAPRNVIYTFGETRNSNGTCAVPTDAEVRALTEQLTKWSAQQKAEGKGGIDTYELWNEPDYKGFWGGTAQQLAHINGIMNQIIKENDPTAKVAAPAVSFWSKGNAAIDFEKQYLTAYKQEYGLNSSTFDQLDFHGYTFPGQAPEQVLNDISQMRQVESEFGLQGKPLVDSEDSFLDSAIPNVQNQMDYMTRKIILDEFSGVQPGFYAYGNDKYGGITGPGQVEDALNRVSGWLNGATLENLTDKNGVYTASLERDGKQETIAWSTNNAPVDYTPPKGYSTYESLDGASSDIAGEIQLNGAPILLS